VCGFLFLRVASVMGFVFFFFCWVVFSGNGATGYFLVFALSASMVGVASVVVGAYHLRVWRTDSLSAANTAAVISGHFTLLAFGYITIFLLLLSPLHLQPLINSSSLKS
jgi:hypothetical protein